MIENKKERILITGGTGLIGTNLHEFFQKQGLQSFAIGSEYDLRYVDQAKNAFEKFKPTAVFHLAAKVGGIYANSNYKADFYSDNVLINTNVVNKCVEYGVKYVFAMGTGCAYPKRLEGKTLYEKDFLDGTPEVTNDAYAYAKRGLLVHLEALKENGKLDFCYCLPANIYGPHDNFHPTHSHVLPALTRRFCEAVKNKEENVKVWGDGTARRDFLYIKDCVDAVNVLWNRKFSGVVNVGSGVLTSISDLAKALKEVTGFTGEIVYDDSYPSGQKERWLDLTKIKSCGWEAKYSSAEGLQKTVAWFNAANGNFSER